MNEEFLQEIKNTLPWVLVAAIVVFGYKGIKNYMDGRRAEASRSVAVSHTTEELEQAVSQFGGSDVGGALRLKLAKSHFDAGRYDEALKIYEEFGEKGPSGYAEMPAAGKAYCLEALGRYDEAAQAFAQFAEQYPESSLLLTAKLGAARANALAGRRDEALAALKAMDGETSEDGLAKARIEALTDVVKRMKL